MFRLLFGILLGAAIVYFLDSRQIDDRRRMIRDRLNRGKVGGLAEQADQAFQAGRETFADARERVQATAGHAAERARETLDEAKSEAQEWVEASKERADAINGSPTKR
jgi:F0F1-type ATP synthase membrane subunit b/b'